MSTRAHPHTSTEATSTIRGGARLLGAGACLALLGALFLPTGSAQSTGQQGILQVDVVGFRNRAGVLLVALYDNSDHWLDVSRAGVVQRHPIRGTNVLSTFDGLRRGRTYAVSVIHDEDRDDHLDMAWLPLPHPAEGAGASRNPRPGLGPPSWDSARFRFRNDRRTVITLVY